MREVGDRDAEEQDDATAQARVAARGLGRRDARVQGPAIREGRDHSNKKNAPGPKWVNIGPEGADYEQNGIFTGHVRTADARARSCRIPRTPTSSTS